MAREEATVVPTDQELNAFELNNPATIDLITRAQDSDAVDRQLTIREALKKHKSAVFWALILSTALASRN